MKTIVCYGDSNTWGCIPITTFDDIPRYDAHTRWGGVLRDTLGADYWVVEEGLGGRTTVWEDPVSLNRNGYAYLLPCLESHQPLDLVALLLGTNWATFIWAVTHSEILQSSLGYYINPLLNVFLGYCFLSERLHPLQWLAVAIAAAGVLISLIGYGHVPWLALILAGCFSLYGLVRKQVQIDSVTGLMVEALLMSPVAVVWLVEMAMRGQSAFLRAGVSTDLLLIGAGVITILPLLLFVAAAKRLKLATLGLMQYISPTGHFICGVFLYGEAFTAADAVTFGCIWTGLALYTLDMWLWRRSARRVVI